MKKDKKAYLVVIILLIFFFALNVTLSKCMAQEVSFRVDLSNAIRGSDVNPPALNYKIGISDGLNYGSLFRFGMEFEHFPEINYMQWTFGKLDYEVLITEKISFLPGVALSQIYHETTYSRDAFSYAFNTELTYKLNDYLKVSVQANRERASDIEQDWRDSMYFGIIYYWD